MIHEYNVYQGHKWALHAHEKGLSLIANPADSETGPREDDALTWAVDPQDHQEVYGHFHSMEDGGVLADEPWELMAGDRNVPYDEPDE